MTDWILIGYFILATATGAGIGVAGALWHYRKNGPRMRKLRRDAAPMLIDVHGTDQVIAMTRPTFDKLSAELQAMAPPPGQMRIFPDGRPWLPSPIGSPKDNPFRDLGAL